MYLQRLELNGFKSFARKTTLEFNRGITSVVGPNGSGKSNIAEAIRWVMGEQSIKSLRAKQSTDVIFSGSDKSARLGLAEVILVFNNEDGQAPIDYPEITITRRIHRDGHSDYFLNNQPTRLHDILLFLAQINLSSKTYSVIGQGMVDEILNITPAQRKEFFEEAAGVKPLQIKKNEAVRKLEHTTENLRTVNIQLNEIAPRLRSLTRQVKRLERRVEIENQLRDLQFHYYGETFYNLKQQNQELTSKEAALAMQSEGIENENKKLQEIMLSLTKESSHSDKFTLAQNDYENIINRKAGLKDEELKIRSELLQVAKASEKTHVPISIVREVEAKFERLAKALNEHRATADSHETLEDWQAWHSQLEELLKDHEDLFRPLKPFLQEHDISGKEKKLREIQSELVGLEGQLEEVQRRIRSLAELEKKEKEKIWQTQEELQQKQQELNEVINERNDLRVQLARVETHLGDLEAEIINEVGLEFLDRIQGWQPVEEKNIDEDADKTREQIHKFKHELELIGGIDVEVQKEYTEIKERYDFLETQTKDLEKGVAQLDGVIAELDETIHKQFNEAFHRINHEFQKYFKMLFRGGHAELKLLKGIKQKDSEEEDVEDEETENESTKIKPGDQEVIGVEITATPPGKKIKTISVLSGGERALTSIALISAIISNNPAPFVVLDEVDAALDEENSMRFAEIVNELSHKTQFVIVTHNRATMEHADLLYGVTMGDDGISKLISLRFEEAQQYTNR